MSDRTQGIRTLNSFVDNHGGMGEESDGDDSNAKATRPKRNSVFGNQLSWLDTQMRRMSSLLTRDSTISEVGETPHGTSTPMQTPETSKYQPSDSLHTVHEANNPAVRKPKFFGWVGDGIDDFFTGIHHFFDNVACGALGKQ